MLPASVWQEDNQRQQLMCLCIVQSACSPAHLLLLVELLCQVCRVLLLGYQLGSQGLVLACCSLLLLLSCLPAHQQLRRLECNRCSRHGQHSTMSICVELRRWSTTEHAQELKMKVFFNTQLLQPCHSLCNSVSHDQDFTP